MRSLSTRAQVLTRLFVCPGASLRQVHGEDVRGLERTGLACTLSGPFPPPALQDHRTAMRNLPCRLAAALPTLLCAALLPAAEESTKLPAFRPPAVPLVTSDPFLSVWSINDRLHDGDTRHWTGKPHTLHSLVRIDDRAYRLMGTKPADAPPLEQTGLEVLPTRT